MAAVLQQEGASTSNSSQPIFGSNLSGGGFGGRQVLALSARRPCVQLSTCSFTVLHCGLPHSKGAASVPACAPKMGWQVCLLCAAFSAGDGSKGFGSSKPAPAAKEAEEEAAEGAGEGSSGRSGPHGCIVAAGRQYQRNDLAEQAALSSVYHEGNVSQHSSPALPTGHRCSCSHRFHQMAWPV